MTIMGILASLIFLDVTFSILLGNRTSQKLLACSLKSVLRGDCWASSRFRLVGDERGRERDKYIDGNGTAAATSEAAVSSSLF